MTATKKPKLDRPAQVEFAKLMDDPKTMADLADFFEVRLYPQLTNLIRAIRPILPPEVTASDGPQ